MLPSVSEIRSNLFADEWCLWFMSFDVPERIRRGRLRSEVMLDCLKSSYVRGDMSLARFEESVDGLVRFAHRVRWTSDDVAIIPLQRSECSDFPVLIGGLER